MVLEVAGLASFMGVVGAAREALKPQTFGGMALSRFCVAAQLLDRRSPACEAPGADDFQAVDIGQVPGERRKTVLPGARCAVPPGRASGCPEDSSTSTSQQRAIAVDRYQQAQLAVDLFLAACLIG